MHRSRVRTYVVDFGQISQTDVPLVNEKTDVCQQAELANCTSDERCLPSCQKL